MDNDQNDYPWHEKYGKYKEKLYLFYKKKTPFIHWSHFSFHLI